MTWTGPRRWPSGRDRRPEITDPDRRARVLADLAEAAAGAGDLDRAEALARTITDPDRRARALADLAEAAAGAGDLDRAEALAGRPRPRPGRSPTRTGGRGRWPTWREAAAGAGDLDRAEALARTITDPDQRARALADLAEAAAGAGDLDRAEALAGGRGVPGRPGPAGAGAGRPGGGGGGCG